MTDRIGTMLLIAYFPFSTSSTSQDTVKASHGKKKDDCLNVISIRTAQFKVLILTIFTEVSNRRRLS